MLKKCLIIIYMLFITLPSYTQINHQFSISNHQLKDELNNGLLFIGANLFYQFGYEKENDNILTKISGSLDVGLLNRKGLKGYCLSLVPLQYYYGVDIWKNEKISLNLGGCAEILYQFQLYPNLQMGNIHWARLYSISPKLIANYKFSENNSVRFEMSNSALCVISRPENFDPYFFSLRFSDIVSNAHSDFKFKTINELNNFNFNLDFIHKAKERKIAYGYSLHYIGYEGVSFLKQLNHSLSIKLYRK